MTAVSVPQPCKPMDLDTLPTLHWLCTLTDLRKAGVCLFFSHDSGGHIVLLCLYSKGKVKLT